MEPTQHVVECDSVACHAAQYQEGRKLGAFIDSIRADGWADISIKAETCGELLIMAGWFCPKHAPDAVARLRRAVRATIPGPQ